MTSQPLDPLTVPPPAVDEAAALQLLAGSWGLDATLTPLHGERDLNFRVTQASGRRFVLKIHNPADGAGVVDFHTSALRHITDVAPDLPVGEVVPTADGAASTTIRDRGERTCHARLLTHLDGHHADRDDLGRDDLYEWGRTTARLGRALRGFFHPEAGYPIAWDIRRLPAVRDWAGALGGECRDVVLAVIARHEATVGPTLASLRAQVVHNDLSRDNVLVDDRHTITGITDFGDMTHTTLVCDLAVAIADVLDGRADSVELAESMIAGYVAVTPLEADEAAVLADLVAGRCAASLAIQGWRLSAHETAPQPSGGAWQLLQQLLAAGLDEVSARFVAAAEGTSYRARSTADLHRARSETFGPLSLSYEHPLHLVRGEGVELYAADGRVYLDAYNNVPVLGHSHPAVTAAVTAQLRRLNTNTRYLQDAPVELAERLIATLPDDGYDRVLFVNSGSEANDLAWRIACFATQATGAIVTDFAYHGVTTATAALSPESWPGGEQPDHIRLVDPPGRLSDGAAARTVATAAAELVESGRGVAAMFVDGVFTSDGVLGPAAEWAREAVSAVRACGGLYVADEVQAGHGRTGAHLWSFVANRLDVDLVTLGKPMGNGYPIAAVIGRSELIDSFMTQTDYFSTFGGGTAACAAALAVLAAIDREGLVAHANEVGVQLTNRLTDIAERHPVLAPPRAWGLAVGVDVRAPDTGSPAPGAARRLVERLRGAGVLVGLTGRSAATLKIRPPLAFTTAHADRLAAELTAALSDLPSG